MGANVWPYSVDTAGSGPDSYVVRGTNSVKWSSASVFSYCSLAHTCLSVALVINHLFSVALAINHYRKRVSAADSVISEYPWQCSSEARHSKESKIGNKIGITQTSSQQTESSGFHEGSIVYIW